MAWVARFALPVLRLLPVARLLLRILLLLRSARWRLALARGLGLVDMVRAIEEKRVHRCSDALALHVLEAMEASLRSADAGSEVALTTTCERPAPPAGDNQVAAPGDAPRPRRSCNNGI